MVCPITVLVIDASPQSDCELFKGRDPWFIPARILRFGPKEALSQHRVMSDQSQYFLETVNLTATQKGRIDEYKTLWIREISLLPVKTVLVGKKRCDMQTYLRLGVERTRRDGNGC